MDVDLAWTVVAFLVGLVVNRRNQRAQHAATVRTAQEERFELLQRDTWVALQDALGDLWLASQERMRAAVAYARVADEGHDKLRWDAMVAAMDSYAVARQRAMTLSSRLAEQSTRFVVDAAIETVCDYETDEERIGWREPGSPWALANNANEAAIELLGGLIRTPPASGRSAGLAATRQRGSKSVRTD